VPGRPGFGADLEFSTQNYDLVFRQFDKNFRENAWNSSEMAP